MSEINITGSVSITKDGLAISDSSSVTATLAGFGKFSDVQSIGFSAAELIVFPADLIQEGISYIWLKNLDATNFVTIIQKTGANSNPVTKLFPGEAILIHNTLAPTNDPGFWAQADTGACNLQVVASGT
jgi:hypothetical protein